MPIVRIWNVKLLAPLLVTDVGAIQSVVVGIHGLDLRHDQVTVQFPEQQNYDMNCDIVIEVVGLFVKPGRTAEVRKDLAHRLVAYLDEFQKHLPPRHRFKIECLVCPFDPEQGFATSENCEFNEP